MTDQPANEPRPRTLAEVFAQADPGRRFNFGVAVPGVQAFVASSGVVAAAQDAMIRAWQPQLAEFYRGLLPVLDNYARTIPVGAHIPTAINTSVVNELLREFNGISWAKLAEGLSTAAYSDWSPAVVARTLDDDVGLSDTVVAEVTSKSDWRTETWRAYAVLAISLYITLAISTLAILGPDALDQLRDNTIAIVAIYGAVKVWGQRNSR